MGNVATYFAENTNELSKTKLLKLVYLAEELFVKNHATPFLGVPFYAWQFGPVQRELWANLDPSLKGSSLISEFVSNEFDGNKYLVKPLKAFNDDEFSEDEMLILQHIAQEFKFHDAQHLVFITHKGTSLWHKTVSKEDGLMERFESRKQTTSDIILDFGDLIERKEIRDFYYNQLEMLDFNNSLKSA